LANSSGAFLDPDLLHPLSIVMFALNIIKEWKNIFNHGKKPFAIENSNSVMMVRWQGNLKKINPRASAK